MLIVFAIALLVFLGLVALIWLGTHWAQGYFYDSPVDSLYWRAPAAAGALALFFLLWAILENRRPNTADTLFRFTSEHADEFDHFISVRRDTEGEREIRYQRRHLAGGKVDFVDDKGQPWARSKSGMMIAIILEETVEGDPAPKRSRFAAQLSPDGKTFKPSEARGIQQAVRYYEDGGPRFIVEDQMGKAISYRKGRWVFNVFLNVVQLVIWFLALWLLLRFQWPHALLGGAVCWLVVTLAVLPFMIDKARDSSPKRATPKTTAALSATGPIGLISPIGPMRPIRGGAL